MSDAGTLEGLWEWADYMVSTGLYWTGVPAWSNVEQDRPSTDKMSGFTHSFLVALAGNAGAIGPYKLAEQRNPGYDVGGGHLNEVMYGDASGRSVAERELLAGLAALAAEGDNAAPYPKNTGQVDTMGFFLAKVCRFIADGYELRYLECDEETGQVLREGPDIAQVLPSAFVDRWMAHPIVTSPAADLG